MSSITDFLAIIATGHYGRDVRQAIVDGIEQCYEDGRAGATDLTARQLIEQVMATNEDQEAEIDSLEARVDELEGGSESSGTTETTTTTVDTVIIDHGVIDSIQVNNNAVVNTAVTFTETFTEAPIVLVEIAGRTSGNAQYGKLIAAVINNTVTTTGFTFYVGNASGATRSPSVNWIAIQPTTTEINTDITIPATDDLTEEQIAALIALLD